MFNKIKGKTIATGLIMGLVMILLAIVPISFANPDSGEGDGVTVYFTLQNDGQFVKGNDTSETTIAQLPITVPYFPLADYQLDGFDHLDDNGEVKCEPTILHLLLIVLEEFYCPGTEITNDDETDAINVTGVPGSAYLKRFWGHDENLMYYVNHKFPLKPGSIDIGSTCDEILLENGMMIELSMFTDWNFYHNGAFAYFSQDRVSVTTGGEIFMSLMGVPTFSFAGEVPKIAGAEILIDTEVPLDISPDSVMSGIITDENGNFTYSFDTPGTYYISALIDAKDLRNYGEDANTSSPLCVVTVTEDDTVLTYEIRFMDDDEVTVIGKVNVVDGADANFNTIPSKEQAGNTRYTFSGWSPEEYLINVTENRIVYATYTETVTPSPPMDDNESSEQNLSENSAAGDNGISTEIKFLLPVIGIIASIGVIFFIIRRN